MTFISEEICTRCGRLNVIPAIEPDIWEAARAWQALRDWLGPSRECVWTQSEYSLWETDCGNAFELNDGGPHDNDMAICCYCGGALVEQAYEDAEDDDEE